MTAHGEPEPESYSSAPRRPGRRPGKKHTADRIVDTALEMFAASGLDSVTIRAVAARAEVDAALVHHFYRSKEGLFAAAVTGTIVPPDVESLLHGPLEAAGSSLAGGFLAHWEREDVKPRLQAVLRSVPASDIAATLVRRCLDENLTAALTAAGADAPRERAALVGTHLVGLAVVRYVLGYEPLAGLPAEQTAAIVGPAVSAYLTFPIALLRGPG